MSKPKKPLSQKIEDLQAEVKGLKKTVEFRELTITSERLSRSAAQHGLVAYVKSLERFNGWLVARPELQAQLQPILVELGLWNVRLGYDPDRDPAVIEAIQHNPSFAKSKAMA